ncbi:MAG TPA: hypothetical protein VG244_01150 [Acidimicrobiales bacterium]|nr:hypothetical protein [Acidimicrobiales bacterium]
MPARDVFGEACVVVVVGARVPTVRPDDVAFLAPPPLDTAAAVAEPAPITMIAAVTAIFVVVVFQSIFFFSSSSVEWLS